jgi:hypothetical protein
MHNIIAKLALQYSSKTWVLREHGNISNKISATIVTGGVPEGKVNILGDHSIGHSKEKSLYEHVCYSERFPIFGEQYFEFDAQYFPSLPL